MPNKLLPILAGMFLASVVVVAGLLAFILPPDTFEPTVAERAAAEQEAQAEAEAEGSTSEDSATEDAADTAPGGGDSEGGNEADPGGEDTGDVAQEDQGSEGA
ncbi:MAG: hypothetical protein WD010_02035 [Nitriliruptor sp.]|uniref:hypothetical protein n=1 Tax=Nitriliruptor sp. TaxID=2448056 RepID=UPI0034A0A3E7